MNKKRLLLGLSGVILFAAIFVFLTNPGTVKAVEQCRIVRIEGHAFPQVAVRVDPELLSISKGTCVVWVNWARTPEVRVTFNEGKRCKDNTKAPVGFKLNEMGCYLTDFIPEGGTSSLLFDTPGTFDYVIESSTHTIPTKGRIVVSK